MSAFSLKQAALAGPSLIRRAPTVFGAWVLIRFVEQYLAMSLSLAIRTGPLSGSIPAELWGALIALPIEGVLMAAVLRALLRPEDNRAAYLRLGPVELRMMTLIALAFLAGLIVALPVSLAGAYVAYYLHWKMTLGALLGLGAAGSALALLRLAALPAVLVDIGRFDPAEALAASRGRYIKLAFLILAVAALGRFVEEASFLGFAPPSLAAWPDLLAPRRIGYVAWDSLAGLAVLTVMSGVVVTARRSQ